MPSSRFLTRARIDLVLVIVALSLLAAPLWVSSLHLGAPVYEYERAEVVIDDEEGITYVNTSAVRYGTTLTTDIACVYGSDVRSCAFERHLLENNTVPTGSYTNNPDVVFGPVFAEPYRYVQADGVVYEVDYVANRSEQDDRGMYLIELDLSPVSASDALRDVSVSASDDLPDPVREAAASGTAESHQEVEIPQTPVRLEDGTYYRVYQSDRAGETFHLMNPLATYLAPLLGLYLLYSVSQRIAITYVGDRPGR